MTSERAGYAIFTLLAFLVAWWIRNTERERIGLPKDLRHAQTGAGALIGAAIGAKLMMILYLPFEDWWQVMAEMARLDFDGKTVIGGLTGGYIGVELVKRLVGIQHSTGDMYAVALPVGHAIGRFGCMWNGCCYGAETTVPWAIPLAEALRHPAQAYESIGNLVLAAALWTVRRKTATPGQLFRMYLVGYAVLRFCLDPFRGDAHIPLGPLSFVQWYCVVIAVGMGALVLRDQRR